MHWIPFSEALRDPSGNPGPAEVEGNVFQADIAVAGDSTGHWMSDPQMLNRIYWSEICSEADVPLNANKCV